MPRNDKKAYGSVIARVPQELIDRMKSYAEQHRYTMSEIIREGLEMRLFTILQDLEKAPVLLAISPEDLHRKSNGHAMTLLEKAMVVHRYAFNITDEASVHLAIRSLANIVLTMGMHLNDSVGQ